MKYLGIGKNFAMKYLGEAAYILGIKIYRDRSRRLIRLHQNTYLDKILKKLKMKEYKKGFVHMQHVTVLSKIRCPGSTKELDRMSRVPYASTIGTIMYAKICTRPNISYALNMVSRFQANLGKSH